MLYLAQYHTLRTTSYNTTSHTFTLHFLCARKSSLAPCLFSSLLGVCFVRYLGRTFTVRSHQGTDGHHGKEKDCSPYFVPVDVYATLKSLCLPDSPADRTYIIKYKHRRQRQRSPFGHVNRSRRSGSLISVTD